MDFLSLKTFEDPKRERGSKSFANYLIIGPVCFFLGVIFSTLPYDYPLLWTRDETPAAFFDQLETHLRFMHASPPLISRILHIAIFIGYSGLLYKLYKPSEANLLFDGASLVLYTIGVIVYGTNIVKGLRIVTLGEYENAFSAEEKSAMTDSIANREDSLTVLAASNTILALVLVGVLVLQAGQWYAEHKDADEEAKFAKEKQEKMAVAASQKGSGHATRSSSKKKQ